MSYVDTAAVSVTTNATALCTAKETRAAILISNADATEVLYVGTSATVTTATGTPVPAGQSFSDSGEGVYKGIWYGISTTTISVRVADEYLAKQGGTPL